MIETTLTDPFQVIKDWSETRLLYVTLAHPLTNSDRLITIKAGLLDKPREIQWTMVIRLEERDRLC